MSRMIKKYSIYIAVTSMLICIGIFSPTNAQESQAMAEARQMSDLEIYQNDLRRIEKYLNGITTFTSTFTQEDSEGERADGIFYLWRPGRLRWQYYPPSPILIIAKGSLLTYYDSELDQVSHIGIEDSLSGFLTKKVIDFNDENIEIVRFSKANGEIHITIAQKDNEEEGELTLVFRDKDIELQGMSILDAIGKTTSVTFETIVYGRELDKDLFILPKIRRNKR
jgi:outer membrane lipoprotein-sorting protein